MRLVRNLISVFLVFELLFTALVSGGRLCVTMPAGTDGEYGRYVNAFVGTGGIPWMCGMLSPAASVPFGCVRNGPDTSAVGGFAKVKTNTSGYYYEHRHIRGFSLSRLSGTGAYDYGMFRVTPNAGAFTGKPKAFAFSHLQETASPGYYAVYLPGAAALCEMTASSHAAMQRYSFTTSRNAGLYIDAASALADGVVDNPTIQADCGTGTLTGSGVLKSNFSGRYGGLPVYIYGEWDREAVAVSYFADGKETQPSNASGVYLAFGDIKGEPVTLRIGVSFVSAENAKENLLAQTGGKDFDAVRDAAAAAWEEKLSSIRIDADDNTKSVFYTALYHAMLMPSDFTDVNGEYLGFDGSVHTASGYTYRTDISLWDTCRDVHALYTLIAPDIQSDCLNSLLAMAEQGGTLPRWPMGSGYTGSMFGNPADIVFAESLLKGMSFDVSAAYEAMKYSTDNEFGDEDSRDEAPLYNQYGYLPDDLTRKYSVSKTLEYAWEDAAIATVAKALGKLDEAAYYAERSKNYRNLWDAETGYFRPKNSDGSWGALYPNGISFVDDIFGTHYIKAYCEGSARHWRWCVMQDPDDLVSLFGSKDKFVSELNDFMADASLTRAAVNPGSGYWIGNQHDLHAAYLFNHADRPDLTQKWVRWTLKNRFSTDPDGLDGNDDGGTLSSWYVFSALGFYPIAGTDRYWIGSPCVDSAEIKLPGGALLKITANNQSEKNIYVSSVALNGVPLEEPFLTHADLAAGGELVFEMSAAPAD